MTGRGARGHGSGDHGVPASDMERYRAVAARAGDPERLMEEAQWAFSDLMTLTNAGDRSAAAGAAISVLDRCLELCAAPSTTARAADDKRRFLRIIARWAFARSPAVAAVLEAARRDEERRWRLEE